MLKQNQTINAQYPFRLIGGVFAGERTMFGRSSLRNMTVGEGITSELAGVPSGHLAPSSWVLPYRPGAMSSRNSARGVATGVAAGALGLNIAATSDGIATVTGTAQLVVSGVGSADGVATVSGNVNAALGAAGSADASATVTGSLQALAWGVGLSAGAGTASIVSYATGRLVGSIAPAVDLEAATFSTYLLDEEDVETGLTLRQALRLVAAATAGKISGASGTTITIRNPVADSKDRIVATVDTNGNRTALTYDLT